MKRVGVRVGVATRWKGRELRRAGSKRRGKRFEVRVIAKVI